LRALVPARGWAARLPALHREGTLGRTLCIKLVRGVAPARMQQAIAHFVDDICLALIKSAVLAC